MIRVQEINQKEAHLEMKIILLSPTTVLEILALKTTLENLKFKTMVGTLTPQAVETMDSRLKIITQVIQMRTRMAMIILAKPMIIIAKMTKPKALILMDKEMTRVLEINQVIINQEEMTIILSLVEMTIRMMEIKIHQTMERVIIKMRVVILLQRIQTLQ